jgi:hypothetical protein
MQARELARSFREVDQGAAGDVEDEDLLTIGEIIYMTAQEVGAGDEETE